MNKNLGNILERLRTNVKQDIVELLSIHFESSHLETQESIKALLADMHIKKDDVHAAIIALTDEMHSLIGISSHALDIGRKDLAQAGINRKHELTAKIEALEGKYKTLSHDIDGLDALLNPTSDARSIDGDNDKLKQERLLAELKRLGR